MFKRISIWFYKVSTVKKSLFFLMVFVLFSILVLPMQSAEADAFGAEVGSPDLSFYYTSEDLYKMAEAYGLEGRDAYIKARFTFDVIWPFVYGAFLITSISTLFLKSVATYSTIRYMNLLPLLGMFFDFLENISTSLVMWKYPERMAVVDSLAPIFTSLKWILLAGAFVFLVFGILVALKGRVKSWRIGQNA